ncbi:hypothetical protein BLD44_012315 [Mastigocladus laminosus UU774]|nr:hypothetical protein BLD44_012315 [Mastigocladus laminosus UU774]
MVLQNSHTLQTSDTFTQLVATLQDIASKVEIQSNFSITHPDYKPVKLSDEIASRFQQLSLSLQYKFLNSQLCHFLYYIYYNGAFRKALALNVDSVDLSMLQNLENNTFLGVDLEFYERLHSSNNGEGYFDPGWQVLREESDDSLVVKKSDLSLYIQRNQHLQATKQDVMLGEEVAIKMPSNLVQNGFYMAVGNAGSQNHLSDDMGAQIVRVYFNLSPEGAVAIMGSLTRQLNTMLIPFTFKALYNPSNYERYDTAVLYFEKTNYGVIREVLLSIYVENMLHFREEVPLFTKVLAPGLALAEEPNNKFFEKESFGLNRCQIIANALLEAEQQGNESLANRMMLILKHFDKQGIDLHLPYLNPGSKDIYATLS